MWYEQPHEGSYAHSHEEYGSWQSSHGGLGQRSLGGYSTHAAPSTPQANVPAKPKTYSFDALRALQGQDNNDSDSETEAGLTESHPSDPESAATAGSKSPAKKRSDDSDEDVKKREVGKTATQEERDEAAQIVGNAMNDVKERDRMRAQLSTASPADLQAMLNSRLKR